MAFAGISAAQQVKADRSDDFVLFVFFFRFYSAIFQYFDNNVFSVRTKIRNYRGNPSGKKSIFLVFVFFLFTFSGKYFCILGKGRSV